MSQPNAPEHLIAQSKPVGKIPSGVFILTAQHGTDRVGMIASWVQQMGFEPLTVAVALHPDRAAYKLIQQSGRFTLNTVGEEQYHLMKAFGKNDTDGFSELANSPTQCGIKLHEAHGYMDCVVKATVPGVTDHVVVLAEVIDGHYVCETAKPFTHLRKNGFSY